MTREQQYIQEQYMRRQQLLRNYARIAAGAIDEEQEKKENPGSQEEIISGLNDPEIKRMKISDTISLSGASLVVEKGRELTIELNQNKIQSTDKMTEDSVLIIQNGAKLTIEDTYGNGSIDGSETMCGLKVTKAGGDQLSTAYLTINGGTFKGKNYGITGNGTRQNTSIVINDGNFEGLVENDSLAVFQPQKGDLVINGGYFKGGNTIWVKAGNIEINGGVFESVGPSADYIYSGNGFNNTGDCIVVDNCGYPGTLEKPINIKITGGDFTSLNNKPVASYAREGYEPLSGFVQGGTFNKELDEFLIDPEYEQKQVGEKWVVTKKSV